MQSRRAKRPEHNLALSPQGARGERAILAIGEVRRWRLQGNIVPSGADLVCAEFHELTADLIALTRPRIVLSPLLCGSFDCLDVALALHEMRYQGAYRVLSADLPDPWLIRSEVADSCPYLDFDIVDLKTGLGRRLN